MQKVLTVEKCFDLLECIATQEEGLGTRELARTLGINVTTVHNIALTLLHKGYLHQDQRTKKFSIGSRFILLGQHNRLYETLDQLARPIMAELSAKLDESIMLATLDHSKAVSIAYIPSSQALRVEEPEVLGSLAYCTAVGKMMLATMSNVELEIYIRRNPPKPYTAATIIDPVRIIEDINQVRADQHSHTCDELLVGVSAVAVAVRDPHDQFIAALGASAPTVRMQGDVVEDNLKILRRAGKKIAKAWFPPDLSV